MSKSRPKSQQLLLDIIKDEVTTRLEQSLDNRIYIITNKEEDPSQVKPPWAVDIQISSQPTFQLPPNTTITDIYNREDIEGRLLILGAPGSGKTTTLLQLAQDLIAQAEENTKQPIPVLLNLSSWIDNYQSFKTWIIDNLDIKYGISKNTSKQWLNQEIIIPLLDGLDELAPTQQEKCVEQINEFLQLKPNSLHNSNSWSSSLVVCSRTEEYCYLVTQLRLNGSIILQPLTQDQIYNYVLNTIGEELWNTLISVPDLMELVKTPLFLNILALSFQEFSFERWQNLNSSQDKIIELFNIYISTMLNRNYNQQKPENEKTKYWLAWLANQLTQENKTEFFVENISPSWVKNENQKTLYEISLCIISAVIFGCNGVIGGLFFGLFYGFKEYSINGKIARDIINNFRYVLSASTMLGFILSPSLGATPTISPDMYKKLYFPPIIQIKKDYSIEIQTRKVLIKEPVENLVYCNKDTYLSKLETFNKSGINIKTIRVDDYLLCGLIGASCHLLLFWLIRLLTQSNELSQSNESIIINSMQMLFTGFSGFFGGFFIGILPIYLQKVNLKDLKW